jgi:clan AA aspartic protease
VTGYVDEQDRALLAIGLCPAERAIPTDITVWIDTAFTGDLVLPRSQITALGLPVGVATPAILTDGSRIEVDTFTAHIDWFGRWQSLEVIANDGMIPLLGMSMLRRRRLTIDYAARTLTLD